MRVLLVITVLVAICFESPGHAWGEYGHEQVADAAIDRLDSQSPLKNCFVEARHALRRLAISPDVEWKSYLTLPISPELQKKREDADRYEHSLHFQEVDTWILHPQAGEISKLPAGDYPAVFESYREMLVKNADEVQKLDPSKPLADPAHPTVNEVTSHGTAPWRALQLYRLGREALQTKDLKKAFFYLGTMAHYVGDMSMPFHASLNYDGQVSPTPARGVHSAVDSGVWPKVLQDAFRVFSSFDQTAADVQTAALAYLTDHSILKTLNESSIVASIFEMIDPAYFLLPGLLEEYAKKCAEAQAALGTPSDPKFCSYYFSQSEQKSLLKYLPKEYMAGYSAKVIDKVKVQVGDAAALLASIWQAAFNEAGAPQLENCAANGNYDAAWQAFVIENYPRPNDSAASGYMPQGWEPEVGH